MAARAGAVPKALGRGPEAAISGPDVADLEPPWDQGAALELPPNGRGVLPWAPTPSP